MAVRPATVGFMDRKLRSIRGLGFVVGALLSTFGCGVDKGGLDEVAHKDITRDAAVSDLLVHTDVAETGGVDGAVIVGSGGATDAAVPGTGGAPGTAGMTGTGGVSMTGAVAGSGGGIGPTGSGGLGAGGGDQSGTGGSVGSGGNSPGGAAGAGDETGNTGGSAGDDGVAGMGVGAGDAGGSGGAATGGTLGSAGAGGDGQGAPGGGSGQGAGGAGGTAAAVCDAKNCATGCCAGSICIPMPTATQCGHGGAACQACASCQRCSSAGACELDPMSHWQMTAVSAVLAKKTPGGRDWDPNGEPFGGPLPDPFAQFEMPVGTAIGWTSTLIDTTTPMWNELLVPTGTAVQASDLLQGGMPWQIWIGDEDANQQGQVMCEINGPIATAAFNVGGFSRTNIGSCLSVQIALMCVP
jgi:hypothetical protein